MRWTAGSTFKLIGVAVVFVATFGFAQAIDPRAQPQDAIDLTQLRQFACGSLQTEYNDILHEYNTDPGVVAYRNRIVALENAGRAILYDLASTRSVYLARSMATLNGIAPPVVPQRNWITPQKILQEYFPVMSAAIPFSHLSSHDQELLQKYYTRYWTVLQKLVCTYAFNRASMGATGPDQLDLYRLCCVLPWLQKPDDAWSPSNMRSIPDWATKSLGRSSAFETVALQAGRPKCAYLFECLARSESSDKGLSDPIDYFKFLRSSANRLYADKNRRASNLLILEASRIQGVMELPISDDERMAFAQELERAEDAKDAAAEVSMVLFNTRNDELYGKAAVMRLTYLYESSALEEGIKLAAIYKGEDKCHSYLAQILYLGWRMSETADPAQAAVWEQELFSRYPQSILCADIRFSQAVNALAEGKYGDAERLLSLIQSQYPKTTVSAKARIIEGKMMNMHASLSTAR